MMTLTPDDGPAGDAATQLATCHFPGCTRPSRPDAATGRPAKYCEDVVDGVLHNRANAWHRRRAARREQPADTQSPAAAVVPVSLARATLDERLMALPEQLARFTDYLNGVVDQLRTASDLDAAGAEVEDAHREALAKVAEAEHRAAAAERSRREAETQAAQAASQRSEADAAAEDALAELDRARTEFEQQLAQSRAEAETQIRAAEQRALDAEETARRADSDRIDQVQTAQQEAHAARRDNAAAQAAREAADQIAERERQDAAALRAQLDDLRRSLESSRAETAATRAVADIAESARDAAVEATERERLAAGQARELADRVRHDAQTERETLRAEHAEHVHQLRQDADQRAGALAAALDVARGATEVYQAQLRAATPTATKKSAKTASPPRQRSPRQARTGDDHDSARTPHTNTD